jgi:hypothetical protein
VLLQLFVMTGGVCESEISILTPALWALNMSSFFTLIQETWRFVIARDSEGRVEVSAEGSFPVRGVLSWMRFVVKLISHALFS